MILNQNFKKIMCPNVYGHATLAFANVHGHATFAFANVHGRAKLAFDFFFSLVCPNISMLIDDLPTQSDKPKKFRGGAVVNESHKESSPCSSKDRGSLESKGHTKNQHNETSKRRRKRDKENHEIGMVEISPGNK
jgi:hypothetical protein